MRAAAINIANAPERKTAVVAATGLNRKDKLNRKQETSARMTDSRRVERSRTASARRVSASAGGDTQMLRKVVFRAGRILCESDIFC